MAFINAEGAKADRAFWVPLESVTIDPSKNFSRWRTTEPPSPGLIEDIRTNGQHTPVICRRVKPSNSLELVAGFNRAEAIRLINEGLPEDQQVKLRVIVHDLAPESVIATCLGENLHVKQLNAMDRCKIVVTLRAQGKSDEEIATGFLFCSVASVYQYGQLDLLEMSIKEQVADGLISLRGALELLKVEEEHRASVVTAAVEAKANRVSTPRPPGKRERRAIGPSDMKAAANKQGLTPKATKPLKRSMGEVVDFFTQIVNEPAAFGPKQRDVAQFMLDLISGASGDDDRACERLAEILEPAEMAVGA